MAELILNPRARLLIKRRGGEASAVIVAAPVRGRPLHVATFTAHDDPVVFRLLVQIAEQRGAFAADLDEARWSRLAGIGLLVAQGDVPFVPRFRCALRDPSRELVP